MALINACKRFYGALIAAASPLQHLFLLAVRLLFGWAFFLAGRSKFENIDKVAEFFSSLSIPYAEANAYLVASVECAGGICLLLGFASRLLSLPLTITMVVALLTAHITAAEEILREPPKFFAASPVIYLFASLTIFLFGPGRVSIDAAIKGLITRRSKKESP